MNFITCLSLSAVPHTFDLPPGVTHINHVSQFTTAEELHTQRLAAIMKVDTPTFFFQDDDVPLPNIYPDVMDVGMVYGDYIKLETVMEIERVTKNQAYNPKWHLANPDYVHKAFCNTRKAQLIAKQLPLGEYWTELLLYYFLGKLHGATYAPELKMSWRLKNEGMHTKARLSVVNSICWILDNEHLVEA